jgi:hypothetical protein
VRCGRAAPPARAMSPISCSYDVGIMRRRAGATAGRSVHLVHRGDGSERENTFRYRTRRMLLARKQNSATRRGSAGAGPARGASRVHTRAHAARLHTLNSNHDSHGQSLTHYMIVQLASACVQATHRNWACQSTLTVPHRSPYHQIPRQPKAPREREKHANQPLSARGQR